MEHEYKCNVLVVHIYLAVKILWDELMQTYAKSQGGSSDVVRSNGPETWFLAWMHVLLSEGYVIQYWELRPNGRTVLSVLIHILEHLEQMMQ